ncbi:MAG: nicotinamide mononucleotide transporter [Ruminiclostridium sp.]|nr:nicotinamide mononucleotide transporter [Ruminiclostridium sp.]
MLFLTIIVTVVFYFILKHFDTANIIPSTIYVTTSFMAVYLTFRRCPTFALAYAANDIVLIVLLSSFPTRERWIFIEAYHFVMDSALKFQRIYVRDFSPAT